MAKKKFSQFTDGTTVRASDQVVGLRGSVNTRFKPVAASYTTFYVEKYGSDTTGDGSYGNPYATPQKAYAVILAAADASSTKPYLIKVGAGIFTGATLQVLPWTFLEGHTTTSVVSTTLPSGVPILGAGATRLDYDVNYHASWATSGYAVCGLSFLALTDGKVFDMSLIALGGTAGSMSQFFKCFTSNENGGPNGDFHWFGRGLADVVSADGIRSPGQMQFADGTILIQNAECQSGLYHGNAAASRSNVTVKNSIIGGNSIAAGNAAGFSTVALFTYVGVLWGGALTMTDSGEIVTDVSSWPIKSKVVPSATPFTITFKNDGEGLAYTPSNPGFWLNPIVTVADALNYLADMLPEFYYGSGTFSYGLILPGAYEDHTVACIGAAVNDIVKLGLPSTPEPGINFLAFVSAADQVTIRAQNVSAAGVTPASKTYNVTVEHVP